MKGKIIYKDKAGNTLVERKIKSRNKIQLAGYNKQGKLVNRQGIKYLMHKAGMTYRKVGKRNSTRDIFSRLPF